MPHKPVGLIMQGGGALGAYEYGAVTCLLEQGYTPVVASGVSIGAINTAVVAGAHGGDAKAGLKALWDAITLRPFPFLPPDRQDTMSMFGNPRFWRSRMDIFNIFNWTALCDVAPMLDTLQEVVDFSRINRPDPAVRMAVTATCIETGESVRFSNHHPAGPAIPDRSVRAVKQATELGPEHILASGSLPPGFPMTRIDGHHYWDGGLYDNTPLEPLLEMLTEDEAETLPIVVLNLFPSKGRVPANLMEAQLRQMEITYESRFWCQYGGSEGAVAFADMLGHLARQLAPDDPIRGSPQFKRLMLHRALRNLHVVENGSVTVTGGMDFSRYGVQRRYDDGYGMMQVHLDRHGGEL